MTTSDSTAGRRSPAQSTGTGAERAAHGGNSSPDLLSAVFGDFTLDWGNKYPAKTLAEIWRIDRDYLFWAANLIPNKQHNYRLPKFQETLIRAAHSIMHAEAAEGAKLREDLERWLALTQQGDGLDTLQRPTPRQCRDLLTECTVLGGHSDLDGVYSVAIAISLGGALSKVRKDGGAKTSGMFGKLRLFRYGFNTLQDYRSAVGARDGDAVVVIDFAALPGAALNLDHHATCLSFWELGTTIPTGIFDTSMPSCPRLLGTHCGLKISEDILSGCDLVDGAQYSTVDQTIDLSNPFVALEHALSLDVSDTVAKKVILTLVENDLDPYSVLSQPIWKARLELLRHEVEEQRSFWSKPAHARTTDPYVAVVDARLAPYSPSRFRYLPFEIDAVREKPYLLTIRSGGGPRINIGLSRNPFYRDPSFFEYHPLNLGSLARTLGKGGGRVEASAFTIEMGILEPTVARALAAVESSVSSSGQESGVLR